MTTYLIRRVLLFLPTLIGATFLVFLVVAWSGGVAASVLSAQGEMRPAERKLREQYLDRRYGLRKPLVVQYGRWLNNISPIGFRAWQPEDLPVRAAEEEENKLREARRAQLVAENKLDGNQIEEEVKKVDLSPDAGEIRFDKPLLKVPDLGDSITKARPVGDLIVDSLPITLLLEALSIPITFVIAVISGIWAAKHRGKLIDALSGSVALAFWSIPVIWAAVLLIGFLANERYLKLFPTNGLTEVRADAMPFLPGRFGPGGSMERGWLLDMMWHLVLPLICLSYGSIAFLHKLTRASLLETIQADFVRTARAKGLSEKSVLYAHAFRNSLLPLITVTAGLIPVLITGSIVVETIFGINGMGRLAYEAVIFRDRELLLSIIAVTLFLTLLAYLAADVAYAIADPRVSFD